MPDIMRGKKILIMGLRNKWSLAWGIARKLREEGAKLAFTYQGERERDGVQELVEALETLDGYHEGGARKNALITKCDVSDDADVDAAFKTIERRWGSLDGVVHAVAHAKAEDLKNDFLFTTREGFAHAMDVSAYSLVVAARKAARLMTAGGSIVTLTFIGSSRVFPGYNVMGVAKAALEASVIYLANDLGPAGVRVNAISAGPVKTISSKAVKDFSSILGVVGERAPMRRGVGIAEVGSTALYLLSDLSSAVTGETINADCGFNIMGV